MSAHVLPSQLAEIVWSARWHEHSSARAAAVCFRTGGSCLGDLAAFTGKVSAQECGTAWVFEAKEKALKATTAKSWPLTFLWNAVSAGQLISATTEEIVKAYYPSYFLLSVDGQIQTRQVQGSYDDSYLGESVIMGCQLIGPTTNKLLPSKITIKWGVVFYELFFPFNLHNWICEIAA